jgi:hypothetical protein
MRSIVQARSIVLAAAALASAAAALATPPRADARPPFPAPDHPDGAPPPAWIETARGQRWLAYSSYCWLTPTRGLCADYVDPRRRTDLPRFVVERGEIVQIYLGFVPTEAFVTVRNRLVSTEASRVIDVRVREGGVLIVHLFGRRGDASYVARLVVRQR